MKGVSAHPNAIIGGLVTGGGLGPLAIWLFNDVFHWDIPPVASAAISGGLMAVVGFIGRKGIVGLARFFWYGSDAKKKRTA